ncbi:PQQ-dependent sugar dehydrogenase [Microbacterium aureliae]
MTGRATRTTRVVLLVVATALAATGCDAAPAAPSASPDPPVAATPPSAEPGLPTEPADVVTGLDAPWSIAVVGDSALVSERDTGRILELLPGGEPREVAVVDDVVHGGEGGLLGLAVSPDGAAVYVYSSVAEGNRVRRYVLGGEPGALTLSDPLTVIDGIPRASTHNGGRLAFGPDGMLYVTTGDAGSPAAAQDPGSLAGKILRLTPAGGIPEDNPFPDSPVYSLGHRNVQGVAWAADGRMFASEFGQDRLDELNVIVAGGNYGWPEVEGSGGGEGFIDPVQEWATDTASPSGIAVLGDTLYIANLRGRVLRAVDVDDPGVAADHLAGELGRLRDVAAAPDGALWILTGNTDGRGDPAEGDDRIVAVDPAVLPPG